MKKLLITALSVKEDVLRNHFIKTVDKLLGRDLPFDLDIVIYTQGYTYPDDVQGVVIVRDDTVHGKGLPISVIRDYFTDKFIHDYDYVLFTDDDFDWKFESITAIINDFQYMESNPYAGMVNMKNARSYSKSYSKINPSRAYMRSGMLVRSCAYRGWGSEDRVIYFEEAVLATRMYLEGYDIVLSKTPTAHITKSSGLGKTIESTHKDNFSEIAGGRQVLCRQGYSVPALNSKGAPDYRKVPKLSRLSVDTHNKRRSSIK